MKLIALGSGGWIPTEMRHTACYLIDTEESLIVLDTGTGLSRLSKYTQILDKYDEINIIYSHYHLDHIAGLYYISNWSKDKKINIYGPGKKLGFISCEETIFRLISPPCYPVTVDKFAKEVKMKDYDLEGFNIGNISIKINPQTHSGSSFGISVGDYLHYATDTVIHESTFKAAEDKKILLHDCWSIMNQDSVDHSYFEGINSMLNKYKIEKLGLIHINPNWEEKDFKELNSTINNNTNIIVVKDNMAFELLEE